jgi:SPX domain protein involved in polyphosphate accumulation
MKSRGLKKKAFQVSTFVPFWTHMCPFSKKLIEIKIKITSHIPLIYFHSKRNKEQK